MVDDVLSSLFFIILFFFQTATEPPLSLLLRVCKTHARTYAQYVKNKTETKRETRLLTFQRSCLFFVLLIFLRVSIVRAPLCIVRRNTVKNRRAEGLLTYVSALCNVLFVSR